MNRIVKITGGDYKGYEGVLKNINNTYARVELSSKTKTVSVEKNFIKDPSELNNELINNMNSNRSGSRTPSYYPKTAGQNGFSFNSPSNWNSGATRNISIKNLNS